MAQLEGYVEGIEAYDKHYEWQLFADNQWLKIDHDHVIERHYCQPGAKGITINTRQGKVNIDFDKLQTLNPAVKVQRLSFLHEGQSEDIGWYFRDDTLWREYGSQSSNAMASSIMSRDVERQFTLNCRGTFNFTVGSTSYSLDFSSMTQTNCTTGLKRKVRRRPKFNFRGLTSPSISTSVANSLSLSKLNLSGGSYKWEFTTDDGSWAEYQEHICAFGSSDLETQYQKNPQGQLQFRINGFNYTLDLQNMCQTNHNTGKIRAVRRTGNNGSQQNSSSPRWQFLDIGGVWRDYTKGPRQSSVSSQDIELQYQQNPAGTMAFTATRFNYVLNFLAMSQTNLTTNTSRQVQRLNQ
ncbi:uncharacterized protein si:ch211-244b2.3 [Notolabrus celidotus]|uniref:uncharacterized protein si:ch211-244b2.3 n=1 Tax=Notolabrus celidotus TaxID=1203425 RepID=UPI0014905658|nr:uncharacterized protein si:ch211-244b2.3 [Notolabrus celidotus]